jgi:hypothetical protein
MADKTRYQVVSAAVVVPVETDDGVMMYTLYRPAVFTADPDNERIRYNVDSGYIVELGDKAVAGVDAAGTPLVDDKPTVGDGNPGDPVALNDPGTVNEVEHRKAVDATAADAESRRGEGRRPGRPSNADRAAAEKADLVAAAVRAGMDRSEAEKASVADLRAALKK